MSTTIVERLAAFRKAMAAHNIDAFYINSADAHNSEYPCNYWRGRKWLSGFTGTAGAILVTQNEALLWTDGRYFIQAAQELEGTGIELMRMAQIGVPTIDQWLKDNLETNANLAFDARTISSFTFNNWKSLLASKNIQFTMEVNILDEVWADRPAFPDKPIFEHPLEFAGESVADKLIRIRQELTNKNAEWTLISALDDVAWTYNYRGRDILYSPVAQAFTLISQEEAYLFIELSKVPAELKAEFDKLNIQVLDYTAVAQKVAELKNTSLYFCPHNTNSLISTNIDESVKTVHGLSISNLLKAVKNPIELEEYKKAHLQDGIAMVQLMKWLEENVPKGTVKEYDVDLKVAELRSQRDHYLEESFKAIPGYAEHGALMHYGTDETNDTIVGTENFFLLDSGGQYLNGTTDITRTFSYGDLSDKHKTDYTLALRAMIGLSKARFKRGSTGSNLDTFARGILWLEAIDYGCGTGHGVGTCLNVHEGPHSIHAGANNTVQFKPNMIVTNEPGIYREGEYGIRIENIQNTVEDCVNQFGEFYSFETLTLAPICTRSIKKEMMSQVEIDWLNNYHQKVYNELSPLLAEEELTWLEKATQAI